MTLGASDVSATRRRWLESPWDTVVLIVLAFAPLLLTKPGLLADDTKVYLYLDPSHLLATAASMWNTDVGFGTVTHQNIGYLFPMGPYYWICHALSVPTWIAQRVWMGGLLFLAGLGARKCAAEMGLTRRAGFLVALAYMLSPFIIVDIARTSALLMPWAGLGWMMVFTIRAAHRNDWRNPALFAIVVALAGGINATSILTVGLAPIAWLFFAAATREIPLRRVRAVLIRMGSLSLVVSLWWLAGLWAEGKYGINILKFTESFSTVTLTSSASEVFRGLGYWYFYGTDGLQLWTGNSIHYTSGNVVPLASFLVPATGFVAALVIRWRYRLFAVGVTFIGLVVAVASYPLSSPTPFGVVLRYLATHTTVALAMRSTNRVIPIMTIGLALLAGALFDALVARWPRLQWWSVGVFSLACITAMSPLFTLRSIPSNLTLPETPPSYVQQAAKELNTGSSTSNVLGLPGFDFAYYRYGTYNDSLWPALVHRPWISSQVQLVGEPASINLIRSLDSTLQDGVAEPASIAPIARLFGASNVLVQFDGQYERYGTPLPPYLDHLFSSPNVGMTEVGSYGPQTTFTAINGPYINENTLALPPGYQWPPSLKIYSVSAARPLVRVESTSSPYIVAGNGAGLVTLANVGGLSGGNVILYDASTPRSMIAEEAHQAGATLVLTDSNTKSQQTFGTLNATQGYVLAANEKYSNNEQEQSIPVFPNAPANSQTVAELTGLSSVTASSYGNPITNNPENQAYKAVDGDSTTSWATAAFSNADGQWWQETALEPHRISSLQITQARDIFINRYITKIGISVDGRPNIIRTLTPSSQNPPGQTISIPPTTGRTVRITILGVTAAPHGVATASMVGFSEVAVPGFGPATRGLLLPTSLLAAAGSAAQTDSLKIVVSRLRVSPYSVRADPEPYLLRYVDLPYSRSFTISGTASLNSLASDQVVNEILGRHPGAGTSIIATTSSSHIKGSLANSSWSAFDGSLQTLWQPRFKSGAGEFVQATLSHSVTIHTFKMTIVNDGYHAVPTEMSISNGRTTENFAIPTTLAAQGSALNTEQIFTINVPAITGSAFRFTTVKFKTATVLDRVSGGINFPPIAIADIAIPGVTPGVTNPTFSSGCRSDLLKIDGVSIPIRVSGSSASALAGDALPFTSCATAPTTVSAGQSVITSSPGLATGLDLDDVQLSSTGTTAGPVPTVSDAAGHWYGRTVVRSTVGSADAGQWAVLGQSYGPGWHAILNGRDLGTPTLVDGASMGWRLPSHISSTEQLAFVWQPQNTVLYALLASLFGFLAVLGIAVFNWPRRRGLSVDEMTREHVDATPVLSVFVGNVTSSPLVTYTAAVIIGLFVSIWMVPFLVAAAWVWRARPSIGRLLGASAVLSLLAGIAVTMSATLGTWTRDITWPAHVHYSNSFVWFAMALWFFLVIANVQPQALSSRAARPRPTPRDTPPPAASATKEAPRGEAAPTESRRTRRWMPGASKVPVVVAPALVARRRRGLNVADPDHNQPTEEIEPDEPMQIPVVGLPRTLFFLRAARRLRHQPEELDALMRQDTTNLVVGRTAIFNREVLEIADPRLAAAEALAERGARVTAMRVPTASSLEDVDSPTPRVSYLDEIPFQPLNIPVRDGSFDLVIVHDIFSFVDDPRRLLEEVVRVTRPGGSIFVQNRMWLSPTGGFETSPWHLVSGSYGRRRYRTKTGHEPDKRFGETLFALRPHELVRIVRQHRGLALYTVGPRLLGPSWRWTLKVPLMRDLIIHDLVVVIERR